MATQTSLFEAMPLELHFKVLSHLSSPEDVLSTMHASPAVLKAIAIGRERVYVSVLEAALAPEVFRELLAIVYAPDHNKCSHVPPPSQETNDASIQEWRAWERRVRSFLKRHARGAVYPTPDPHVDINKFKTAIKFMVRLYFCLSKFVNFYQTFVRSIAGQLLRLQRGLLRHELCCRLIGLPSKALSCNEVFFYQLVDATPLSSNDAGHPKLWFDCPFRKLLPIDELEEINCASFYLRGLYQMYHSEVRQELQNELQILTLSRGDGKLDKDGSEKKKETVDEWMSLSKDPMINSDPWTDISARNWTDIISQLGLVFLDRFTKSTLADRRVLIRDTLATWDYEELPTFHCTFRLENHPRGSQMVGGAYCNLMVRTSIIRDLHHRFGRDRTMDRLRVLGWAFFDDPSRLGPPGLPNDANSSTIRAWLRKEKMCQSFWPSAQPRIPDTVLGTFISKNDWEDTVMAKYACKDHYEDYHAMALFVAGIRAVSDLNSTQLPAFD
ncbi:hypothetical protein J7T55_007938 [Diaporthe amygdali]|uniref:uncharacterized protein n=1 Tax=Phomopsis amygdali TaxID=1214568 RepID=UPI0022FDC401|nr:uncharacterized protein J7T55_007938 [Diaporthe amygdali]KAJ0114104.1 hypothetical protein J7T55_007938 [Diaporthe amygdali]